MKFSGVCLERRRPGGEPARGGRWTEQELGQSSLEWRGRIGEIIGRQSPQDLGVSVVGEGEGDEFSSGAGGGRVCGRPVGTQ